MASLYDLELAESNNFIHSLLSGGQPYSLKFMEDQVKSFEAMGEAGKAIIAQFQDPNSEMGKSYTRLKALETDLKATMGTFNLTAEMAQKANDILTENPQSMADLGDEDKKIVSDYWLKKKSIATALLSKGYTPQELYA